LIKRLFFLLVTAFVVFPVLSFSEPLEIVTVGINRSDLTRAPTGLIERLKEILGSQSEYTFIYKTMDEDELKRATETRRVDLIISSSSFFRQIPHKGKDIASVVSPLAPNPDKGEGAVILTRADNLNIRNLIDLKGKRIGMSSEMNNTPFLALKWELASLTDSKIPFFGAVIKKESVSELLQMLKTNEVQAVVLPVCSLENFTQANGTDTSRLRVLNRKSNSSLSCVHSTSLFPSLTLFGLPHISSDLTRTIASILNKSSQSNWNIATDYSQLDRVLRFFDLDPYAKDRKWTIQKVINDYWQWLVLLLGLIIGSVFHAIRTEALVKTRTTSLFQALEEKSRLNEEAKRYSKKIEKLQKIGALGQMSSLFAHELRQPLNSIICFSYALRKSLLKGEEKISKNELVEGLSEIQNQAKRANEIVSKVRAYIHSKTSEKKQIDINKVIADSIYEFESTTPVVAEIKFSPSPNEVITVGDPLELEIVFINLFRNAVEAQLNKEKPFIEVTLTTNAHYCYINICDYGPPSTEELIQLLNSEIESSKPEGLGLGLSIVRMLLEKQSGSLVFEPNQENGLRAIIKLPVIGENK